MVTCIPFKNKEHLLTLLDGQLRRFSGGAAEQLGRVYFILPRKNKATHVCGAYSVAEARSMLEQGVEDTLRDMVIGSVTEAGSLVVLAPGLATPLGEQLNALRARLTAIMEEMDK